MAELGEQHTEHQRQCKKQDAEQFVEGLLLLLVRATVDDANRSGQVHSCDGLLHFGHRAAKVRAFQLRP